MFTLFLIFKKKKIIGCGGSLVTSPCSFVTFCATSSFCVEGDGFPGVTEWHLRVSLGWELAATSWEQALSGGWKLSRCLRLPFGNWGLVSLAAKSASFQAEICILCALGRKAFPHGEMCGWAVCAPQELRAQGQSHWMLLMVLLWGLRLNHRSWYALA